MWVQSSNLRRSYCDFNIWPNDLENVRVTCCASPGNIFTKFIARSTYPFSPCSVFLLLKRYVTLWPWPLTSWSWPRVVDRGLCDQIRLSANLLGLRTCWVGHSKSMLFTSHITALSHKTTCPISEWQLSFLNEFLLPPFRVPCVSAQQIIVSSILRRRPNQS